MKVKIINSGVIRAKEWQLSPHSFKDDDDFFDKFYELKLKNEK